MEIINTIFRVVRLINRQEAPIMVRPRLARAFQHVLESTNHAKPPRRQILTFPNRVLIYSRLNKLRSVGVMRPSQSWKISQKFTIACPIDIANNALHRENLEISREEIIVYNGLSFEFSNFLNIYHIFNAT